MPTSCRIGIQTPSGEVRSIYCHWDGHPALTGAMLATHYTDEESVQRLMDLGNLSALGKTIGQKHSFTDTDDLMCIAYGRDRGDAGQDALFSSNADEYVKLGSKEDYLYLYSNGKWSHTPA